VPPAAATTQQQASTADAISHAIVCVANLERDEGIRDAIWTFDILLHLYAEARLRLVGAGAQRQALAALAQGLQNDRVQFLGAQADADDALRHADVVWIPSQANCGRQVALEAMALGRAVVASDVPCLREVIRDGETGFLAPKGDVISFARRTHLLFRDARLRGRIGASARQSVERRYTLADAVERWREVYRKMAV